ncbi:hypothetical protein CAPTEDRAFT_223684 [Capitella teleta]|uniref:Uncharacterized protein n=1 Tax=Capitella teleta TaxID=283909 RepID=R7VJY0_CAPTE|nr:hypothetical protein CAPTEDRAFT_223684 [Capitella teleta]|eukprot:ELU16295.1 hypothetical protein CAPTEDRAFT_223684 [Capitella teleta]
MMTSASAPLRPNNITLPELLAGQPRNTNRRYEQTKPVLIQSFTHHNIVDLGKELHQRTLQRCADEQRSLVQATKEAIRAEAAKAKEEALMKAAKAAKLEQENVVTKLNRLHERDVKREILKVEADSKNLALKQLQKERDVWQSKLHDAVAAKEIELKKISEGKVEEARQEERQKAELAAREQVKIHQAEIIRLMEENRQEREKVKLTLEELKEKEKLAALADLKEKEQCIAQEKLNLQKHIFERQIAALTDMIKEVEGQVDSKIAIITQLHQAKRRVEKELLETRVEFEAFITSVQPYQGEPRAEYVMPPLRSMQVTEK